MISGLKDEWLELRWSAAGEWHWAEQPHGMPHLHKNSTSLQPMPCSPPGPCVHGVYLWGLKTPGKLHHGETHTKLWDSLLEARPGSHSKYQRKSPQLTTGGGERGRPGRKGRLLLWTRPACRQKELPRAQPAEIPLAPNWPGERETPSPTPTTAALPIKGEGDPRNTVKGTVQRQKRTDHTSKGHFFSALSPSHYKWPTDSRSFNQDITSSCHKNKTAKSQDIPEGRKNNWKTQNKHQNQRNCN